LTNLITGHGDARRPRYFAALGMPLVKTVTRAGPKGKCLTRREIKLVFDEPADRIGQEGDTLAAIEAAQLHVPRLRA